MKHPVAGHRPVRDTLSNTILEKLAKAAGGSVQPREVGDLPAVADCYMQWGWKLTPGLLAAMRKRLVYIILDHGYFQDRANKFSISINGFHGGGLYCDSGGLPPRPHPPVHPPRLDGETVYVMGQLTNDRAVRGQDMEAWCAHAARAASDRWPNKKVIIRPHPKMLNPWDEPLPPLASVWEDCFVAVTWTSTVGVEAVLQGVPLVAVHPASPAFDVASPTLNRYVPGPSERDAWLHDMSYLQYGFDEMDAAIAHIQRHWHLAEGLASQGEYDKDGLRV